MDDSPQLLRPLDVIGVRTALPAGDVVVLLRPSAPSADEDGLVLPVMIGPREGLAIASYQAGIVPQRPQTHDLMLTLLRAAGRDVERAIITSLSDGVFHALVELDDGTEVDARTSDAIALALRAHAPVLCRPQVLTDGGIWVPLDSLGDESEGGSAHEDELERFREFLDSVGPEDFEEPTS